MTKKMIRLAIISSLLVLTSVAVPFASKLRTDAAQQPSPIVYSEKDMLQELWYSYKQHYIEEGTFRTVDKQQNDITTSEGQSYSMLRSVWLDDRATFDASWQWTKDNLQRDDFLLSWKFGERPDGSFGIQDHIGGDNTASDADSDVALALLMAYNRWQEDDYLYDAIPIIKAIWQYQVVSVAGRPVLAANDIERFNEERIIVNPSYFSPYSYKLFAYVDTDNPWNDLADNSYDILSRVSTETLGAERSSGLPPDWLFMNRQTGEMTATSYPNLTTNFSFDASRTVWRLGLDYAWFKDPRSLALLQQYSFLSEEWNTHKRLAASYDRRGEQSVDYEASSLYGSTIAYFMYADPANAEAVYESTLESLYNPDEQRAYNRLGYYDDNWVWFGMALYHGELPNLAVAPTGGRQ